MNIIVEWLDGKRATFKDVKVTPINGMLEIRNVSDHQGVIRTGIPFDAIRWWGGEDIAAIIGTAVHEQVERWLGAAEFEAEMLGDPRTDMVPGETYSVWYTELSGGTEYHRIGVGTYLYTDPAEQAHFYVDNDGMTPPRVIVALGKLADVLTIWPGANHYWNRPA